MDIAVETAEMYSGREAARLVEICECPPGYAGLSCQVICIPSAFSLSLNGIDLSHIALLILFIIRSVHLATTAIK